MTDAKVTVSAGTFSAILVAGRRGSLHDRNVRPAIVLEKVAADTSGWSSGVGSVVVSLQGD